MFNLNIYSGMTRQFVRRSVVSGPHRWRTFNGSKYLNCSERIEQCHSMMFEDYNLNGINLEDHSNKKQNTFEELYDDDDPSIIALTYYHF